MKRSISPRGISEGFLEVVMEGDSALERLQDGSHFTQQQKLFPFQQLAKPFSKSENLHNGKILISLYTNGQ